MEIKEILRKIVKCGGPQMGCDFAKAKEMFQKYKDKGINEFKFLITLCGTATFSTKIGLEVFVEANQKECIKFVEFIEKELGYNL